jgi:hypothetical protein
MNNRRRSGIFPPPLGWLGRQVLVQRVLPEVVDQVAAEVRDPPQRNILGVVRQADRCAEQPSRGFDRLDLARLKREVKMGQSPADRRVEDGR